MREATEWLADYRDYWEESYQRLDALLDELQDAEQDAADRGGEGGRRTGGSS